MCHWKLGIQSHSVSLGDELLGDMSLGDESLGDELLGDKSLGDDDDDVTKWSDDLCLE